MGYLFGTDGVRGVANQDLTPELAFKLGYYGVQVLGKQARLTRKEKIGKIKVIIGQDTRLSCDLLTQSLTSGLLAAGADVYQAGVLTTPAVAYITREKSFDLGVMISASHNTFEFNGIKFFDCLGYKLPDYVENEIEDLVLGNKSLDFARPIGKDLGRSYSYEEGKREYLRHLRYACGLDLQGMKIAIDCANGAAYELAPRIFKELGADLILLGTTPDGLNINCECGSTNLKKLGETVVKEACHLGLAYDGDADRLQVVDHLGNILTGDHLLAILSLYLRTKDRLKNNTFVATVMSNLGLHVFAKNNGFNLETTAVGDRYVLELMKERDYSLGGEQSGHIIFLRYSTTGDGILSSLLFLKALKKLNLSAYEAKELLTIYPQVLYAVEISNQSKYEILNHPILLNKVHQYELELGDKGRILIRASGTEPVIRIMIEGEKIAQIEAMANDLVSCITNLIH